MIPNCAVVIYHVRAMIVCTSKNSLVRVKAWNLVVMWCLRGAPSVPSGIATHPLGPEPPPRRTDVTSKDANSWVTASQYRCKNGGKNTAAATVAHFAAASRIFLIVQSLVTRPGRAKNAQKRYVPLFFLSRCLVTKWFATGDSPVKSSKRVCGRNRTR